MPDRKKIIESLEMALMNMMNFSRYTPEDVEDLRRCAIDALALLKEQEPVEPKRCGDVTWWYVCGACGKSIDHHDKYCGRCGRAVKWDD